MLSRRSPLVQLLSVLSCLFGAALFGWIAYSILRFGLDRGALANLTDSQLFLAFLGTHCAGYDAVPTFLNLMLLLVAGGLINTGVRLWKRGLSSRYPIIIYGFAVPILFGLEALFASQLLIPGAEKARHDVTAIHSLGLGLTANLEAPIPGQTTFVAIEDADLEDIRTANLKPPHSALGAHAYAELCPPASLGSAVWILKVLLLSSYPLISAIILLLPASTVWLSESAAQEEKTIPATAQPRTPAVGPAYAIMRVQHLQVAYGETLILRGVDLTIAPGELVCLLGRNGVGKTTLLKSMMGLLQPRSGHVYFDERDVTRAKPETRANAGIGYVPQGREIFSQLSVMENLEVGMLANPDTPRSAADDVLQHFPMLRGMLDRKGGLLSGGQQQQLAIARALVAGPKLLILDEPTEGIQPSIIELIGHVLQSLKKEGKVAVLLVEQYLEFAMKLADKYYVMEKGAIVMEGSSANLDKEAIKPYLAF